MRPTDSEIANALALCDFRCATGAADVIKRLVATLQMTERDVRELAAIVQSNDAARYRRGPPQPIPEGLDEKRRKQFFFGEAFLDFMDKLMAGGGMSRSEVATHLTVTLGRFIHDFIDPSKRALFVQVCLDGMAAAAFDDDPSESVH